MQPLTYTFELLSDTFAHGAYQTQDFNRPELRAPSVKGMIRWWHEALGYSKEDALIIFGSVANKRENTINRASSVTTRISPLNKAVTKNMDFMPHKGQQGGSKTAIQPGTRYRLTLTPRRGGLGDQLMSELEHAAKAWLLLGAIGQRSNRAAGSILWDQCPLEQKNFEIQASELLQSCKVSFAVLDRMFEDDIEARQIAGDFLKSDAFGGTAPFGSANPRKPSPLKLKCVEFDRQIKLLAVWDHRKESPKNLERGIEKLRQANKTIGHLLHSALPQLTHHK